MKSPSDMTNDELRIAVATEVMGMTDILVSRYNGELIGLPAGKSRPRSGSTEYHRQVPNVTTDIAAAWEVVEKMREDGYGFILTDCPAYVCAFDLDSSVEWRFKADTAPRAICLAALAAVRGRK